MWPVSCVFVPGNCSGGRSAAVSPLTSGFAKSLARCLTRLHAGASPGASALLRRAARGERRAPWAGRRAAVAYRRARSPARRSRAMRRSQPSQLLDAPIGRGAWKAAGPEPPAAPGGEAQARQAGRSRGNTPRPDRRSRRGRCAQPRALYGPWRGSQRRRARRHRDPAGVRAPEDPSRCDRAPPRAPAMPLRLRAEGGPADRGDRACLLRLRSPGACLLPRRLPAPPYERMAELFAEVLGMEVSVGALVSMVAEAGGRRGLFLEVTKDLLKEAPAVYLDEAGVRVQGSLHWVRVASNALRPCSSATSQGAGRRSTRSGSWRRWLASRSTTAGSPVGPTTSSTPCATRTTYASSRRSGHLCTRAGRRRWRSASRRRRRAPGHRQRGRPKRTGPVAPGVRSTSAPAKAEARRRRDGQELRPFRGLLGVRGPEPILPCRQGPRALPSVWAPL